MKYMLIGFIKIYQLIPGPWHNMCRYTPTCSEYAIEAIIKHGSLKGSLLSVKRLCRCNPWGGMGNDPVPERKKNEKN